MNTVQLEHFDGLGLLSGVWRTSAKIAGGWDAHRDSEHLYFMLDGVIYVVREDPDDGYRSHCRDILIDDTHMPVNVWHPPEEVFCSFIEDTKQSADPSWWEEWYRDGGCQLVEMVSTKTKKVVLRFGTDNVEDYYPVFVASFKPEAMGINERNADLFGMGESNGE